MTNNDRESHSPGPILLTGFDPFGGEAINPSWQAVARLDGMEVASRRVIARQLPTAFDASLTALHEALDALAPSLVIAVGQAGGRRGLSLERVAINLIDARIADNAGAQPVDEPVVPGGPAAYFATLPLKAMLRTLHDADVEARMSYSAGTYVCNHVFYALMHALREQPQVPAGFIHVPFLPDQAARHGDAPSMSEDALVAALHTAVRGAVQPELPPGVLSAGRED